MLSENKHAEQLCSYSCAVTAQLIFVFAQAESRFSHEIFAAQKLSHMPCYPGVVGLIPRLLVEC